MAHILIVDTSHPKAYDFDDLTTHAMGGTESSLLRTALILKNKGLQITVFQQARQTSAEQAGIALIGPQELNQTLNPDHVVILRKFPQLKKFHRLFPQAKLHLWIHTYKNWEYVFKRLLIKCNWQLITNSKTHAAHCEKILNQGLIGRTLSLFKPKVSITYCYNPIPESLQAYPAQERDINKLLFLSAPNKGLQQVLNTFQQINRHLKDLKLYVANPGYRDDHIEKIPNVHYLGALPAAQVKHHIASSLCVFYPQNSFAETFGLIYAEANALGTPVMAHDIGAAREVLHPNNTLIDAEDTFQITKTLALWQSSLPEVSYQERFNQEAIYQLWAKALAP